VNDPSCAIQADNCNRSVSVDNNTGQSITCRIDYTISIGSSWHKARPKRVGSREALFQKFAEWTGFARKCPNADTSFIGNSPPHDLPFPVVQVNKGSHWSRSSHGVGVNPRVPPSHSLRGIIID
jgi:hypothetical protein